MYISRAGGYFLHLPVSMRTVVAVALVDADAFGSFMQKEPSCICTVNSSLFACALSHCMCPNLPLWPISDVRSANATGSGSVNETRRTEREERKLHFLQVARTKSKPRRPAYKSSCSAVSLESVCSLSLSLSLSLILIITEAFSLVDTHVFAAVASPLFVPGKDSPSGMAKSLGAIAHLHTHSLSYSLFFSPSLLSHSLAYTYTHTHLGSQFCPS